MKGNPFKLPPEPPFIVSTVNWRNGKLKSRETFDTQPEAVEAAKAAANEGYAGFVFDANNRTLGFYLNQKKETK